MQVPFWEIRFIHLILNPVGCSLGQWEMLNCGAKFYAKKKCTEPPNTECFQQTLYSEFPNALQSLKGRKHTAWFLPFTWLWFKQIRLIVCEPLLPPFNKSYIVCCQIYWMLIWALWKEVPEAHLYLSALVFLSFILMRYRWPPT